MEMKNTEVRTNKAIYLGQAILDISKTLMYIFWYGMITLSLNMVIKQDYVIWIQTAFLYILKQKIFTKILHEMLKDGLIHLTMMKMIKDHFQ